MRVQLFLAVCALLMPASAATQMRVMAYGDSITAGSAGPDGSYPGQLQRIRPDLEVVNEGRAGDVSDNLDRFRKAIADWPPQLVVLMLGTNDPVCNPAEAPCDSANATPERTVANLLQMAAVARREGAAVVILTPTPAVCKPFCQSHQDLEFAMAVRQAFTERVAEELRRAPMPAGVRVADLRGKFTEASWAALSTEGLHPSVEGSRVIAAFVAARIPKRTRTTSTQPTPGAAHEPDPFARRSPRAPSR